MAFPEHIYQISNHVVFFFCISITIIFSVYQASDKFILSMYPLVSVCCSYDSKAYSKNGERSQGRLPVCVGIWKRLNITYELKFL
ncbi:hypothetical protein DAI22_01g268100 [Oryza sativa Japonica Group]|nr:hypothetical protein DAI22_01g268100 [Oryza sativa Japonica Group]